MENNMDMQEPIKVKDNSKLIKIANDMMQKEDRVWTKLNINSGSELYQNQDKQRDYFTLMRNSIDKFFGYYNFTKEEKKELEEILEEENRHSLNNYIGLKGFYEKKDQKAYIDFHSKMSYAFLNPSNVGSEIDSINKLDTITKEEWNKKQKDSKLKTEDGKYYIMQYDDKIGTYLKEVNVVDNNIKYEDNVLFIDKRGFKVVEGTNISPLFLHDNGTYYMYKAYIPYDYTSSTIVYFVSGKNGDEFGQFATKEQAEKKYYELSNSKMADGGEIKEYAVYELYLGQPYNFWNEEDKKWHWSEPQKATLYTKNEAEEKREDLMIPRRNIYSKKGDYYKEIHIGNLYQKGLLKKMSDGGKIDELTYFNSTFKQWNDALQSLFPKEYKSYKLNAWHQWKQLDRLYFLGKTPKQAIDYFANWKKLTTSIKNRMEYGGEIKVGDSIRIKDGLNLGSLMNLEGQDLEVKKITDYPFASGNKKFYHVEYDGNEYEVREDFVDNEKMEHGGETKSKIYTLDFPNYIPAISSKYYTKNSITSLANDTNVKINDFIEKNVNNNIQFLVSGTKKDLLKFMRLIFDDKSYSMEDLNYDIEMMNEDDYAKGGEVAKNKFDISDYESSEDAYEWIMDNINEDIDIDEETDEQLRESGIDEIVRYFNGELENHRIETKESKNSITLYVIKKMEHGGNVNEGKILFTINDDKIDDLLVSSNLNYEFMDDDGYLLSEKDFEKFKVMVSDKGYDDDKIFVTDYNYANGGFVEKTDEELKAMNDDELFAYLDAKAAYMKQYIRPLSAYKAKNFAATTKAIEYKNEGTSKLDENFVDIKKINEQASKDADDYLSSKMADGGELSLKDAKYTMSLAFDNAGFTKAFKQLKKLSKDNYLIQMSSYMKPNQTLDNIIKEFNNVLNTNYKIKKDSYKKTIFGSEINIEDKTLMADGGVTKPRLDCVCTKTIKFTKGLNYFEKFTYGCRETYSGDGVIVSYEDGRFTTMSKEIFNKHFKYVNKMADGGELKIKDNYKYIGSESLFAPLRNGRNTTSLKKGDVVKVTKIGVDGKEDDVVVNFDGDAILVSKNKLEDSTKFEKSFVKGGETTFMDKVKAVEKNLLKKKKVPAIVQKDYGKTYDKKEARESAMRIIGSQTAKWKARNKMEKGGKTSVSPLKDRIFGSKKNKPGSASTKTSAQKIELNETIIKALSDKAKEYNEKHSNKVSTSTLKAVMRRGMGAFSSSHRPGMTRQGWGYARVNKFLLKKGGKKVKAGYTQDDDLLENGGEVKKK